MSYYTVRAASLTPSQAADALHDLYPDAGVRHTENIGGVCTYTVGPLGPDAVSVTLTFCGGWSVPDPVAYVADALGLYLDRATPSPATLLARLRARVPDAEMEPAPGGYRLRNGDRRRRLGYTCGRWYGISPTPLTDPVRFVAEIID